MAEEHAKQPIAIVGMACRFPGAPDLNAYWTLLCQGIDAITEVPHSRWNREHFYDPDPGKPFKTNTRWGGFIQDADLFDPAFFGISHREATCMTADQRLLLELSWVAMEDAGLIPSQTAGQNIGVFIGTNSEDYAAMLGSENSAEHCNEPYLAIGTSRAIIANRLSYFYDWNGPSFVVDTACSASLLATHLACQSLWKGEASLALAGGVQLHLRPALYISFTKGGFMAPDGRCKAFDACANGYVRSEGVGMVLLKPLSQSIADGDRIYALIRGSAVNHNGRSNGLTAPNPLAQESLLRAAYQDAGISPGQVQYIEAHGTGTQLGDYMELEVLQSVLAEGRRPGVGCKVGSVKTNIGHAEAAAGIAGLIKVALSLQHRQIPPHLHFETPNPRIKFETLPLQVPTQLEPWPQVQSGQSLLAGVSSFGFGGANVHVVLGGTPDSPHADLGQEQISERSQHLLALSARDSKALVELAERYRLYLEKGPQVSLADLCFSTNTGRSKFSDRLAIRGATLTEVQACLDAFLVGHSHDRYHTGTATGKAPKIAFRFGAAGHQYPGMARQLFETQPTFRKTLERCEQLIHSWEGYSLLEVLYGAKSDRLKQHQYAQPILFALEYGLAQLWISWGIQPHILSGEWGGEYVAACVAGVFSVEDGLKLVVQRGKLSQILSEEAGIDPVQRSQLKPLTVEFEQIARQVNYSSPRFKLISGLTGERVTAAIATPEYWCERLPVLASCSGAKETLKETADQPSYDIWLECGPPTVLQGTGEQGSSGDVGVRLFSLKPGQEDWQSILTSLGELYVRGVAIDWQSFDRDYPYRRKVQLPTYPFQRKSYWVKENFACQNLAVSTQEVSDDAVSRNQNISPTVGQRLRSKISLPELTPVTAGSGSQTQQKVKRQLQPLTDSLTSQSPHLSATEADEPEPHSSKQTVLLNNDSVTNNIVSVKQIKQWLKQELAKVLYETVESIHEDKNFVDLGLDSITGVEFVSKINQRFSLEPRAVEIYDYSTLNKISDYIAQHLSKKSVHTGLLDDFGSDQLIQSSSIVNPNSENAAAIKQWLKQELALVLYEDISNLDVEKKFTDLGLDSITGVELISKINQQFGLALKVIQIYDYPTLATLAEYIAQLTSSHIHKNSIGLNHVSSTKLQPQRSKLSSQVIWDELPSLEAKLYPILEKVVNQELNPEEAQKLISELKLELILGDAG